MTAAEVYPASPIKRHRSTKVEGETRRFRLFEIVKAMHPMTVRQVFYQATVRGIVEKSEAGYAKVQTDLVGMRRNVLWVETKFDDRPGWTRREPLRLPYDWITDSTRWQRKPRTF